MTIYQPDFMYANKMSDIYSVILCTIDNINLDSNDETSEIITSTTTFKNTWDLHGVTKSEPLKFNLTIAKNDGTFFDAYEVRNIKKWLCKNNYNWLQIKQDDLSDVYYYCIINNPKPVTIGNMNGGLGFTVTCNAPYPWSELIGANKVYNSTTSKNYLLNIDMDYEDYILKPMLTIKPKANGNIIIKNNTNNMTISFNNCVENEVIKLDCNNYRINSSSGRVMLDYWNKNIIALLEGDNDILLTGNFELKIEYRLPIRVGG